MHTKRLWFGAVHLIGVIFVPMLAWAEEKTLTPQQQKSTAEITEYFRRTTERLSKRALADVRTLEDWQALRPKLREQLFDMLGLWPMPERTDLHATITGTVEHDDFVVEKLHFQSRPGLYVTANFYRPKVVTERLPTILYVCGHGNVKLDGVSYGSKASYQHHAAWFARQGYCCLILDTLQLAEIEGLHHGTYREGMWWWSARGYTPAGVEAWNAVRALDYLETRPEVDMSRIGVTGRSGGGAYTWWLAGIDDRPACLVPVAGITDLENHVVDNCIEGHCDCMYMVNTFGWDFSMLAALAAPRPLLFSNTDKDTIFPLNGVVRTHAQLKKIYELYKAPDRLGLLITEGPHKDTQELQVPAFRWMNRWLQKNDSPITRVADKPLDPKQLKVFADLPADQRNTAIHDSFVPVAKPAAPPSARSDWESLRARWLQELREKSFRGWPASPPPLDPKCVAENRANGQELKVIEYTSDENLRLPLFVQQQADHEEPKIVLVHVATNGDWPDTSTADGATAGGSNGDGKSGPDRHPGSAAYREYLTRRDVAYVELPTRGIGPNQWNPDKKKDTQIQRRFLLLGKTADDGRVWDVCRAVQAIKSLDEFAGAEVWLVGKGPGAGIALYAALFAPEVSRVDLHEPTVSHQAGPYFLNVLRILDMPQAAAMLFPRQVRFFGADPSAWQWTEAVVSHYKGSNGQQPLQFIRHDAGQ